MQRSTFNQTKDRQPYRVRLPCHTDVLSVQSTVHEDQPIRRSVRLKLSRHLAQVRPVLLLCRTVLGSIPLYRTYSTEYGTSAGHRSLDPNSGPPSLNLRQLRASNGGTGHRGVARLHLNAGFRLQAIFGFRFQV